MIVKVRISVLLGENLEIIVLKMYKNSGLSGIDISVLQK